VRYTARGQLKTSNEVITVTELDGIVQAITTAGRAVLDVVFDCGSASGAVIPDERP
jgi:hypothetical protein